MPMTLLSLLNPSRNVSGVQASFHAPYVALEWAATASSATAASTGCTKNAVDSSA